jgi:hypothetical protein
MRHNGLDHPDPVKGLPDQAAIRVNPDGVDGPTGLGIWQQPITQVGGRGFVGHSHTKPGEIA